jgi:hypothetical protein
MPNFLVGGAGVSAAGLDTAVAAVNWAKRRFLGDSGTEPLVPAVLVTTACASCPTLGVMKATSVTTIHRWHLPEGSG